MKNLLLVFAAVLLTVSCQKQAREILRPELKTTTKTEKPSKKYREGQLMIRMKDGGTTARLGYRIKQNIHTKHMQRKGVKAIEIIEVDDVEKEYERLKNDPNVEAVSPNYIRTVPQIDPEAPKGLDKLSASLYPNDPLLSQLWGMTTINAQTAWNAGSLGDTSVIVGLIDEGVKYWHEDLRCVIWTNPFDKPDGIDNDGNGYTDDIHGWDWHNSDNTIFDNRDFHGTHTAGTIGATGNNGLGVIGVCPQVTIISLKFLESWGDDSWAVQAFDYIADLKVRHNLNIVNTSNSWGGGGYNVFLREAIKRNGDVQIQAFCAAGNSQQNNDTDQDPNYPSSYDLDCITAVAASDWSNNMAGFTSYGATSVDLAAPGTGIISCYQGSLYETNKYVGASGTSMSTPHCAGADALYAASHPGSTIADRKAAMLNSVTVVPVWAGKVRSGGILNIATFTTPTQAQAEVSCLDQPADLDTVRPTIPPELELLGTAPGQVSLRWRKGSDNQGIDHYIITTHGCCIDGTTDTTATLTGFQPGVYTWHVNAKDNWGNMSDPTNTVTGTIPGDEQPPTSPTITSVAVDGTRIIGVFTGSTDNIGIRKYVVYWREAGKNWNQFDQSRVTFQFVLQDLSPGTTHEIYMVALDYSDNQSAPSNTVYATTGGSPTEDAQAPTLNGAPSLSDITTSSIRVSFPAASDNIGVTGYRINWRAAGGNWLEKLLISTSLTIGLLSEGTTYEFNYQARDAAGNWSANSATVSGTTLVTPPPPPPPPPPPGDDIAPSVNITSPQDGYVIPLKGNRNVKIIFTATDNVGVTSTQILIDGLVVANNVSSYMWNAGKASPGNHVITCKAFDAAGNTGSKSVTVVKK
jgi:subtilisin family serine protease